MSPAEAAGLSLQKPALYLVGTPIGNLEDITLRALRILKEVDLIACEDTRQTQKLLNHFNITGRTISYHEHNEATRADELVKRMLAGSSIALVSDAGAPVISDPGFRLVSLAIRNHLPVVPIPGASAFLCAVIASGLPSDSFCFRGFLSAKSGERREALKALRILPCTQVFYEAPHRIVETLKDIVEVLGPERRIVIARELTKLHEEFLRGSAIDVLSSLQSRGAVKGEITLVIEHGPGESVSSKTEISIRERLNQIMSEEKMDEKTALKKLAKERGVSKSEAYRGLQRSK
jgi:16S rRNA (cytidine1402-2'-O)-methyltransferase